MKRMNWMGLVVALALVLAQVAAAEMEAVKVGFGSMSIHMNLQGSLRYYIGDETLGAFDDASDADNPLNGSLQAKDRPDNFEFKLDRLRLIFKGHIVSDKITYLTQTEFNAEYVELYDAFIGFHYIPFTALNFGKFLPAYGFFVARTTADLVFVDYPLYALRFMADGARHWRHTGFWVDVKTEYVDAQVGVWNGFTGVDSDGDGIMESYRGANFTDDTNTGKDITVSITGKPPVPGLQIRASFWWGQPLAGYETDDGELKEYDNNLMLFGGGVFYRAPYGVLLGAEYHQRIYTLEDFDAMIDDGTGTDTTVDYDPKALYGEDTFTSRSFYVMAGFNLDHYTGVPVEFVARYDYYDPNTANDDKKASFIGTSDSAHDVEWNVTGGVNYYFEGTHAVLRLNYVHKHEDWKDVLNKKGDDTQTGINNDQLQLQAQVAF